MPVCAKPFPFGGHVHVCLGLQNSDYVGYCAGQVQAYQLRQEPFSPMLERQLHPQIMAILNPGIEATRFGGWEIRGFNNAARNIMLALGLELALVNVMLQCINLTGEQFLAEGNLDAKFLREAFQMPRPTPADCQEEGGDDLPF